MHLRNKKGSSGSKPLVPLEDLFPNAFCWIAHPKESSFNYMKKYIGKHYKDLDVEGKAFRNVSKSRLIHSAVDSNFNHPPRNPTCRPSKVP